ncbi:MAG: methyltransferase domain-containing protein [Bdellovibrionaceae bacterium]|nr:methyltransferase domain-containing protein [Pseudobdellovibrionaceae bacterium]
MTIIPNSKKIRWVLLLFIVFLQALPYKAHSSLSCKILFSGLKISEFGDGGVTVNNVAVTGKYEYNTYTVAQNLKLKTEELTEWASNDLKVLSIAEGVSGLLPTMLSYGVNAKALDLWYNGKDYVNNHIGIQMFEFVQNYRNYLIRGDARSMPIESNSIDIVLSHRLFNNINNNSVMEVVYDVLRILKPGGEARFDASPETAKYVLRELDLIEQKDTISSFENNLLIIKKLGSRKVHEISFPKQKSIHISQITPIVLDLSIERIDKDDIGSIHISKLRPLEKKSDHHEDNYSKLDESMFSDYFYVAMKAGDILNIHGVTNEYAKGIKILTEAIYDGIFDIKIVKDPFIPKKIVNTDNKSISDTGLTDFSHQFSDLGILTIERKKN